MILSAAPGRRPDLQRPPTQTLRCRSGCATRRICPNRWRPIRSCWRLSAAERGRLHQAVARVCDPDPAARRVKLKVAAKARCASKIRADDAVPGQTGIRNGEHVWGQLLKDYRPADW
ncbi:MAG: hypothetical protein KGJ32_06420 [Xanthomonadaceae bacterium]|nr:hypothetical protein [Xanthomonadaceae bacterium]